MLTPYYNKDGITIYLGDCLEVMRSLDIKSDLVLTDPPYGISYQNNFTREKHNRIVGDGGKFSYREWGEEAYRLLKDDAALYAYTHWREYPLHFQEIEECGFSMKEPLIAQKGESGTGALHSTFKCNADWILFAHKGRFRFRETRLIRNKKAGIVPGKGRPPIREWKKRFPACWFGEEFPWSTLNPSSKKKWRHPTIKNHEFLAWIIQLSTDEGDLVIDPFMGSGSTLLACRDTNRRGIGIEIEEEYAEMAVRRLRSKKGGV